LSRIILRGFLLKFKRCGNHNQKFFATNMEKAVYISKEGLDNLKSELAEIESVKLKEIAQKIAEAKDLGDLSENAEYHEAKQTQAFLYGKAKELKYKILHAKIIDTKNCNKNIIEIGCKVKLKSKDDVVEYQLVGSDEADPLSGKISIESPIGSSLLGHKVGEKIEVSTPAGIINYVINEIK